MAAITTRETMKKLLFIALCITFCHWAISQIPNPTWQPLGPLRFPVNNTGQINGIGRVTKVKFDPHDIHKLYATSASGGLWVSTNDGDTWSGTGTDKMPSHKEATVCIDYSNTNIIYLGTGDPNYYYSGYGVWKSTDGGANFAQSNTGMGNRLVDELLMNPLNDSILVAVTDQGIYKSYNAGATWVSKWNTGQFTDMDFKPGSQGRVIYACTVDSMYRSDDAGETWQVVTNGFYIPGGAGGMGLRTAVTAADSDIVYLGMVANRGSLFKSTDGGHSFNIIKDSFALSLTGYSTTDGGQGDYNFDFNVDPVDPNTLYWVSHCTWKSTLGGIASSWQLLTNWYEIVHTDMHHITFNIHDATKLYNANDGAIWLSTDSAATWTPKSDGLGATEISPAASSRLDPHIISIGTQDNGELYHDSIWITNRGGDWYEYMAYDYFNPRTVYYGNGNRRVVSAGDNNLTLPFVNDFNRIVFSRSNPNLAFIGKDTVVRTITLNTNPPAWDIIAVFAGRVQAMALSPADSNKLFIITDDNMLHISNNALSLFPVFATYPTPGFTGNSAGILLIDDQPNIIYMYNGGTIYTSTDTGLTWTLINSNYPSSVDINSIVHDKYTIDQSVFISNTSDVYYRNNTMSAWQNYSHGLPTVADIQGLDQFNNGSPYSTLRVQFYGRGVWTAPLNTNKTVAANFTSDYQYVCTDKPIHFYDSTYNSPTFWNWTFPGGTPSASTLRNPVVIYNNAGIYSATLTSGNGISSDSKTIVSYINVRSLIVDSMPVAEGFEEAFFPPLNWLNYDGGNDSVVWKQCNYGAHGMSAHSMFFDNYSYNESGKVKSMQFGTDFTHYDSLVLTFDVAYQTLQNYSDSLEVTVSTDCGQTFQQLYIKGGNTLATAPHLDSPSAVFLPSSAQWRNESVKLAAYSHAPTVLFSFNNISGYGTYLYVDNINLNGVKSPNTGINMVSGENENITIFPNPTNGQLNLSWIDASKEDIQICIYDVLGSKVKEKHITASKERQGSAMIDISDLNDGMYYIKANHTIAKITLMR
jgi:photosystem II stability/assembly factor-like uncharacterized protein